MFLLWQGGFWHKRVLVVIREDPVHRVSSLCRLLYVQRRLQTLAH